MLVFTLVGESIHGLEELRLKLKSNILILLEDFMSMTFEDMMKNIGEQVVKLTNDALVKHDKKSLNESQEKCLKTLIVDLSSRNLQENSVYKLLCNCFSIVDLAFKKKKYSFIFLNKN